MNWRRGRREKEIQYKKSSAQERKEKELKEGNGVELSCAREGCPVLPSTVQGEFGTPTGVLANPRPFVTLRQGEKKKAMKYPFAVSSPNPNPNCNTKS